MKKILCYCCLCMPSFLWAQQSMEPTISTCTGEQVQCLNQAMIDICVSINLNDFSEPIEFFEIDWDDDTENTIIQFGEPVQNISHPYNLADFFNSCDFSNDDFTIKLKTHLVAGGIPLNNAFSPTFLNPPRANFDLLPATICVGDETCLDLSKSCPTNNYEVVSINYGDGTSDLTGCHIYNQVGTYQVSVTLRNECDESTTTKSLSVIEAPIANAIPLSGFVQTEVDAPLTVCLGSEVKLDGDSLSINESTYEWRLPGASGNNYQWIREDMENDNTPNIPDLGLLFKKEGMYNLVLEVNNACDKPDLDTLTFEVIDASAFTLAPQADGCISLEYIPEPVEIGVTYRVDGVVTTDFPIMLGIGQHIVEATNPSNVCVAGSIKDTFNILAQENARIALSDTTICSVDGMFQLTGTPENVEWRINGNLFDGLIEPDNLPEGQQIITYGIAPCVVLDTVRIDIVKAGITFTGASFFCIDDAATELTANPAGGTFSGIGITNGTTGNFDPQLAGEGEHIIYYELENNNLPSCSNRDSFIVEVAALAVDFQVESCEGLSLTFGIADPAITFDNIHWDFGDGNTSTTAKPTHTFAAAQNYTVQVTITRNGCEATISRNISIEDPPEAIFSVDYDVSECAILAVTITNSSTGSNLQYAWDFGNDSTATDANPPIMNYDAIDNDTVYILKLTVQNDCAVSEMSIDIPVKARAKARFGTQFDRYCSGETILASNNSRGAPNSYEWLKDGVVVSTDSLPPNFYHISASTDTIELCLVATNSCKQDTFCKTLIIEPTDIKAFFNSSDSIICVGDSICFTNFSNSDIVQFDFGDGVQTDEVAVCHAFMTPGTYFVVLRAFGCGFDSMATKIQVMPKSDISINSPDFVCPTVNTPFETIINDASEIIKYTWDFGDSTTANESLAFHAFAESGPLDVCLTTTSINACQQKICKSVMVLATPPAAGFTILDSLNCVNGAIRIEGTLADTTARCQYDFGDGNFSDDCHPIHQYPAAGTYSIQQIITNNSGCMDSITQAVVVRSLPIPKFELPASNVCLNETISLINTSEEADSYTWNFGDGNTSILTDPMHNYNTSGEYIINLTATKGGICETTISETINILPAPAAVIEMQSDNNCANTPMTFSSLMVANEQTNWDFDDGNFGFGTTVENSFTEPGDYLIKAIQTNNICSDTAELPITIYAPLSFTNNIIPVACFGESTGQIELNNSTGTAPFEYQWAHGPKAKLLTNLNATNYSVTITDANRCKWESNFTIPQSTQIESDINSQQNVTCFGGNNGALDLRISGGKPDYSLAWSTGQTAHVINNLTAGTYELSITDANDCTIIASYEVTQNAPISWQNGVIDVSCHGADDGAINLENVTGGSPPYVGQIINLDSETATYFGNLSAGTYSLIIEDGLDCATNFEAVVNESFPIWVEILEKDTTVRQGTTLNLTTAHNVANPVFFWSPEPDNDCMDCPIITVQPQATTTYELTIEDENGCTATDEVEVAIEVERGFAIPKAFSPDGDGHNDEFYPMANNPGIKTVQAFRIYDRWGGLLHETQNFPVSDPAYGWNGTYKNKSVQPGTYVYHLVVEYIDGFILEKQGSILLIR